MTTPASTPIPGEPGYPLSEDQSLQIYRARHLIELIGMAAEGSGEFLTLRTESFTLVMGLIGELLDDARPGMIFERKSA